MSGNSNRIAGSNPKRKANKAAMGIVCFAYETSSAEKYHFAAFVDYGDRDIHTQRLHRYEFLMYDNRLFHTYLEVGLFDLFSYATMKSVYINSTHCKMKPHLFNWETEFKTNLNWPFIGKLTSVSSGFVEAILQTLPPLCLGS